MSTPPTALTLVRLSAEDYDEILTLWAAAGLPFKPKGRDTRPAFEAQLASGILQVFGARHGAQLVGAVVATHDSRKGWINRLAVHPDFRRQGIGGRLIAACEAWFAELGLTIYAALVEGDNVTSQALFRHEGYQDSDVVYFTKRMSHEA